MRWAHGDPSAVARAILAEPVYRSEVPTTSTPPAKTLPGVLWGWFLDHVVHPLFAPIARALGASHGAGTVVGVVLVGLALIAIVLVVFRLVVAFATPAALALRAHSGSVRPLAAVTSAAEWVAMACEAAGRGDYARGIAALFSAALAALDERAIVTLDAARTPGEYRRLVRRARAAAAPPFEVLCERFVLAAYGGDVPGAGDFEAAARAYAAFEPAIA